RELADASVDPCRAATTRVSGGAHEQPDAGRQDAEESAATRRPLCARPAKSVNRDGTHSLTTRVGRGAARRARGRRNPHRIRTNAHGGRLTRSPPRVYARCTSGGARRVPFRENGGRDCRTVGDRPATEREMSSQRHLIRNGFVVSMDPEVGEIPNGDVLVEDGVIVEIGRGLEGGHGQEG